MECTKMEQAFSAKCAKMVHYEGGDTLWLDPDYVKLV